MFSSGGSSLLDTITRICKNSDGDTVVIQELSVTSRLLGTENVAGQNLVTPESLDLRRFLRTAIIKVRKTTRMTTSSTNRTITSVDVSGSFSSFTLDGNNDVATVTYAGDDVQNDLILPVSGLDGVLTVGDQ